MTTNKSNNHCHEKLEKFKKDNKEFLTNPLIKNFLKHKQNFELFLNTLCNPTIENRERLDQTFKIFYFNVRFISFISSSLYFNAINFDKKQRQYSSRNLLTVDSFIQNEEEVTFKDIIEDPESEITLDKLSISDDIADYIINPLLYEAVQTLSTKQKEVLNLVYLKGLSDTQIARLLNKSQQSVSKIHKKCLGKIQDYIKEKGR
ncbi:hypothetical protein CU633_16760 [Bacillus sp. V3-13]|uniref:sigma-70 family RNA polymerase sigma factor n=1 Tax=Bacillus sp. V3-13 TaxID=2053728 RepID=UPI000C768E0B|nr:sigma-70 family RNA polymerase sigma factor [Bacillus sp. V3-13]PLR76237.1 hypothetical protein CU633_16760 [Bacillus sp. V3-13]